MKQYFSADWVSDERLCLELKNFKCAISSLSVGCLLNDQGLSEARELLHPLHTQARKPGGIMAPFIAGLLSAGLRLVANAALVKGKEFIEEKTGVKLDKETFSNEDVQKLKKFQVEHEEELLRIQLENNKIGFEESKLELEHYKVQLADIADARANMSNILTNPNVPWYAKVIQPALAVGVVTLTFFLFAYFICKLGSVDEKLVQAQKEVLIYILGVLSAALTQILGFYFGSSQGSANKSAQINQVLQAKSIKDEERS